MDWTIAVLVFFLNVLDDILCVFYTRRIVAGKAIQSGVLSGILTAVVAISVINYVDNKWYLAPIIAGSMIGSYVAIKLDKYWKRRKRNENRKRKGVVGNVRKAGKIVVSPSGDSAPEVETGK